MQPEDGLLRYLGLMGPCLSRLLKNTIVEGLADTKSLKGYLQKSYRHATHAPGPALHISTSRNRRSEDPLKT